MNEKLALSVYGLALMERDKNRGMEVFCNELSYELPYLALAKLVEDKEGTEAAYGLRDNAVPVRKSHWTFYPELEALEEWYEQCGTEEHKQFADVAYLDRETDFEQFGVKNFMHSHYHTLKAHLLVRNCLSQFMRKRVELRYDTYRIKHSGEILTTEEMAVELEIFVEAVRTVVDATMQKRYNFDAHLMRDYCYRMIRLQEANPLTEAMLTAITPPKKPGANLSTDELSLDGYESRICKENLADEVMRFLVEAYTLVYREI